MPAEAAATHVEDEWPTRHQHRRTAKYAPMGGIWDTEELAFDDCKEAASAVVAHDLCKVIGAYVAPVMKGPRPAGFAAFVARHDDGPIGVLANIVAPSTIAVMKETARTTHIIEDHQRNVAKGNARVPRGRAALNAIPPVVLQPAPLTADASEALERRTARRTRAATTTRRPRATATG